MVKLYGLEEQYKLEIPQKKLLIYLRAKWFMHKLFPEDFHNDPTYKH